MIRNALMPEGSGEFDYLPTPGGYDSDITRRATFFPVAEYGDGEARWAWPGLAANAWNALMAIPTYAANNEWRNAGYAGGEAAGSAMTGGLVVTRPANALAAGGGQWVNAYHGKHRPLRDGEIFKPGTYFTDDPKVASSFAWHREQMPLTQTTTVQDPPKSGIGGIIDMLLGRTPTSRTVSETTYPSWNWKRTREGAAVIPVKINTEDYHVVDWSLWNKSHKDYRQARIDDGGSKTLLGHPHEEFWQWHAGDAIAEAEKLGAPGVILRGTREERAPNRKHDQIIPLRQRPDAPSVVGRYDGQVLFSNGVPFMPIDNER